MSLGSTSGANKIVRGSMDFRLFGETTDPACQHGDLLVVA